MFRSDIIEAIKSDLIDELRRIVEPVTLSDLALATEFQEYHLCTYLSHTVIEYSSEIIPGSVPNIKAGQIEINDRHYELVIRDSLPNPEVVEIWLIQRDLGVSPKRHRRTKVKLGGSGLYKTAHIYLTPDMKADLEFFGYVISTVFKTGYNWYEEMMHRLISEESVSARNLYSYIRTILPSDDLLKEFWLVSMNNEKGCYLVDDRMASSAIPFVSKLAKTVGKSPMRLLSEFITGVLPFEVTHSKSAVAEDLCIDVDLTQSKYLEDKSLFVSSEIVLLGSQSISIFPIVRTGSTYFLAIFSTKNRSILEPILTAHKHEIAKEFDRFRKSFNKLIELLNTPRRQIQYAQIGELIGSAIGAIIKP